MKRLSSFMLFSVISYSVYADDTPAEGNPPWQKSNGPSVETLLTNYGLYLGYELDKKPSLTAPFLVSATKTQLLGGSPPFFSLLVDTFLGAIPMTTSPGSEATFIPGSSAPINSLANATFPSYSSGSQGTGESEKNLSVSALLDQMPYQSDPVSQGVLNLISTPDYSYCLVKNEQNSNKSFDENCQWLTAQQVTANAIPILPPQAPEKTRGGKKIPFLPSDYSSNLGQLNSNSLIGPLMYSTDSSNHKSSEGLPAQNQLQEAANYIRYATGGVTPPALAMYSEIFYDNKDPAKSKVLLSSYFAKLRVYAAQSSVGYSNLYYMLSKRMPQSAGASQPKTSQALTEFQMATWRLFNSDGSNSSWLSQINEAPASTVNKEMATLLAEINYQLYLSRQLQERQLLTNTILLLESGRASLPLSPSQMALMPTQ
jgi:intracellular multiplication protein IcmX